VSTVHRDEQSVLARIEAVRRRPPRLAGDVVTLAHGAGGKASAALVDALFVAALGNDVLRAHTDAAVLDSVSDGRVALSTDSFVVQPLQFPGGSIGDLAVNGTLNDLAMVGARPRWLAAAFVLDEGLPIAVLRQVVADMARSARDAGVPVVAGDTKVVQRGGGDAVPGLVVTTTGVGVVPHGRDLDARRVQPGDAVLLSGTLADHGMAVMLARGNLALDADIRSDTAALHRLSDALLNAAPATRWLRDPTRGGLGTVCNELARACELGVVLEETALPVRAEVAAACDILGIDPLHVANEGKLVAVVPQAEAAAALAALRADPLGRDAAIIGHISADPPGMVVLRTALGGSRIVDMLSGDPLPRIC